MPDAELAGDPSPRALLNAQEVASRLSISARHAYRLMQGGEIATVRISQRCLRVRPEDLTAFILENRTKTPHSEAASQQESPGLPQAAQRTRTREQASRPPRNRSASKRELVRVPIKYVTVAEFLEDGQLWAVLSGRSPDLRDTWKAITRERDRRARAGRDARCILRPARVGDVAIAPPLGLTDDDTERAKRENPA